MSNPWLESQPPYNRELDQQVYDLMEKFARNPSNANRYFEAVMALVEDKQKRDRDYDLESGQWEEAIRRDEQTNLVNNLAQTLAYEAGLGVGEWEAFVEIAKQKLQLNQLKGSHE